MRSISSKAWIIDDDQTYQTYLTSYLHQIGYTAKGFCNADETLKNSKEKPDLIILDHHPDDLSAASVLKDIKAEVPVIYISNQEKVCLVSEALNKTSVDVIENDSVSLKRLKTRIEKIERVQLLRQKRRRYKMFIYSIAFLFWLTGILFFLFHISA